MVNTIVVRHAQMHRNEMTHSLGAGNANLQTQMHSMQQYLAMQGASPALAASRAYALVSGTLGAQARLWSYIDDFRYMALVCFGCIPIVFMLKKAVGRGGVSAGH